MKKAIFFTLLSLPLLSEAQKQSINLTFFDDKQKPVIGASVKLVSFQDSTKILSGTADTLGSIKFNVSYGQFKVIASSVGFKNLSKGINVSDKTSNFRFLMETDVNALGNVTVVAKKPLITQDEDKTIIDPEPLAASSSSSLEILEKTPGVFVDQDGNVYLSSSTPAQIYINGREQRMSTADIANILRSLPPNSIDKIEVLRTPSAKYDASGSGGLVNIILKKGIKIGRMGSVNSTLNQGKLGNQSVGISLNNNEGKRSTYTNLNFINRDYFEEVETNRTLQNQSILSQKAYSTSPAQVFFGNYGLGVELNKKWELNIDGRGSYGMGQSKTENENTIGKPIWSSEAGFNSQNQNKVSNNSKTFNFNQGVSTKYKIDSIGSELTSDVSYNIFTNRTDQNFITKFTIPQQTDIIGNGEIANNRHFFSSQVDLKYKFNKKTTLETGLKSTIQRFDNQTDFTTQIGSFVSKDLFRTNAFDYRENINAAYLQGSRKFGEFLLKIGTRLENTNMKGNQKIPRDTTFSIHRTDLFPYVYLSRKVFKIASYELRGYLIYRRTITRPVYEYLNPFPRFIDQYLYEAGNPSLKPQFTQNIEANISFDDRPIFALGKNYTQDIFTNVVYQDPKTPSIAYRTYDNLGKNEETYFRLTGAIPPGGKYFFVVSSQYNFNEYDGLYEDKPLTFRRGSWSFFTYHQLKLDKRSTLSLNGFYRLKGQQQFYELGDFGSLNLTINRYFLNRKLLISASGNDIFYTNNNTFTINQGNISAEGFRRGDTRRFVLNIRYNFGLKKREDRVDMFNIEGSN